MAIAQLIPSNAADIIPPAKPAPSPQGYKFLISICYNDCESLGILTGEDVLLSSPIN